MSHELAARRGFTVIETLVVIVIVLLLAALALPAVQQARESARLAQCRQQLKQLGVALHAYHAAAGQFPPGTIWSTHQYSAPRATYMPHLFPYLGQAALYDQIDWNVAGTLWCNGNNQQVVGVAIPALLCPSDRLGGATKPNRYCGEHAMTNYMAFFGENLIDIDQARAAFGANFGARYEDLLDGASQTMLMSEYLTGTRFDLRGGLWGDEAGMSLIFTELSPNSPEPDRLYPNPVVCDPNNPVTNNPAQNLPCVHGNGFTSDTAAARSRHAGGVHILLGDGGVRFVNQHLDLATWRGLGAIADGTKLGKF
jgi:prepilin-type N-terminal cleavage/methylation domain-containing protein